MQTATTADEMDGTRQGLRASRFMHNCVNNLIVNLRRNALQLGNAHHHVLFWKWKEMLEFICNVSNDSQDNRTTLSVLHREANRRSGAVFTGDWKDRLGPEVRAFADNGKYATYTGTLMSLVRMIRNLNEHWTSQTELLQDEIEERPREFLCYFNERFPSLLTVLYVVVSQFGTHTHASRNNYLANTRLYHNISYDKQNDAAAFPRRN